MFVRSNTSYLETKKFPTNQQEEAILMFSSKYADIFSSGWFSEQASKHSKNPYTFRCLEIF